jgi:hypothetical protein
MGKEEQGLLGAYYHNNFGQRRKVNDDFPSLSNSNFIITSPPTREYNCIAWAAGDPGAWWWPDQLNVYFWPESVEREATVEAFENAYGLSGYARCDDGTLVPGVEKIALYCDKQGVPTHAARQLACGCWTSKLGQAHDISHNLPDVQGPGYGTVAAFFSRRSEAKTYRGL